MEPDDKASLKDLLKNLGTSLLSLTLEQVGRLRMTLEGPAINDP